MADARECLLQHVHLVCVLSTIAAAISFVCSMVTALKSVAAVCLCFFCCRYLALDEADRMVDLGFEEEVRAAYSSHTQSQGCCPKTDIS